MSAARVAVTVHVPVAVAVSEVPVMEQLAVPAEVTAYENAPVPEPPVAVIVCGVPTSALVEVSVMAA